MFTRIFEGSKLVPEIVRVSPPRGFKLVLGETEVTVIGMVILVVVVTATTPLGSTILTSQFPPAGIDARAQNISN